MFGGLHSITATDALKNRLASNQYLGGRNYRLLYNGVALVTLLLAVAITRTHLVQEFFYWQGAWRVVPVLTAVAALVIFVVASRGYDLREFVGLPGNGASDVANGAAHRFGLSFVHRYVRHPWYFALLLLLWVRDLSVGWFVANICITLYLVIGVACEERRLQARFGVVFTQYRQKVPALIPWPGRSLSEAERGQLQRDSAVGLR